MFWILAQFNHYRIKILNQFYGHIKVSIYIYAILKYIFVKTSINTVILKCLTLLLSPMVFIIIWLLKIAKTIVACWVAYTEPNYVSMLTGTETVFLGEESKESRAIITNLFLLEDKENEKLSGNDFHDFCVENISQIFAKEKFLKLQCSVQYKLGYFYFKKENWPINTCFKEFNCHNYDDNMNNLDGDENKGRKMTLSMEQLRVYISEVSNLEMPHNGASMWEGRVSKQKLEGTNLYPMILRFNHIFGDAITIFNMLTVDFQKNHKSTIKPDIQSEIRSLDPTYTQDPFITMNGLVDPCDSNFLCQISGNKHIVWFTEEKPQILKTIKEIKQKQKYVDDTINAVDVLLTCFMESLTSYFVKIKVDLPPTVYTVLPMMPQHDKQVSYGRVTNYEMSNQISMGFLRLPLKLTEGFNGNSLIKRLKMINREYNAFKNVSLDYWCNRWQGTVILTLLPWFPQEWFIKRYGISLLVSNIPGCDSLEFFGRLNVKEFVFIDPNTSISGVSLMITSYEKRLNFAYTIDKAVIPKVEDVKQISTDFLVNLEKLKQMTM